MSEVIFRPRQRVCPFAKAESSCVLKKNKRATRPCQTVGNLLVNLLSEQYPQDMAEEGQRWCSYDMLFSKSTSECLHGAYVTFGRPSLSQKC